ncbi:MAG TPA: ABC transporter substrate-binding protein [Usitatibacter sp.]|nr:ABC transporter substrate-binding protein [Usitatibacter sp.]
MNRSSILGALAAALTLAASTLAAAEVSEVKMMSQFGIGYMQLTVMKHDHLIEKHLKAEGLPDTKVTWAKLGAGSAANDALLSGSLNFAAGGTGPAIILWDKTHGTSNEVRGVAALSSMPCLLVTRDANVKTIKDFTDKDRISLAGAGSSVQTIYLQMAVAKEYGIENYRKLNPLMVKLTHPEGMRALLSGQGEITAQFTSPPFQNMELEHPNIHVVLNSYDVMGGPNTFLMLWATDRFRQENPKTYKAVIDALKEATESINQDKRRAAEVYSQEGGGKEKVDFLLKIMEDPQVHYTLAPERILPYAQFMHKVGIIKHDPESWKDLFFPEVYDLPGS